MSPVTELVITMAPPPASMMAGATALQAFQTPLTLTSMWLSRQESSAERKSPRTQMPALQSSTSIWPYASIAAWARRWQSA